MKLAVTQTPVVADIAANGRAIRTLIARAAEDGARLVLFGEAVLTGYARTHIVRPEVWADVGCQAQDTELHAIAESCARHGIYAVVGAAHRLGSAHAPHNSLYVFSDSGELLTRYDKRFLSNTELQGWYSPGAVPITFAVDGYGFGYAICIESQFPELFAAYERLGVDAVLLASSELPLHFRTALQAHAGLNCLWVGTASTLPGRAGEAAGIIGPDGRWMTGCAEPPAPGIATAVLDRNDPAYDIALNKARPWRATARQGDIYRSRMVDDPRSTERHRF